MRLFSNVKYKHSENNTNKFPQQQLLKPNTPRSEAAARWIGANWAPDVETLFGWDWIGPRHLSWTSVLYIRNLITAHRKWWSKCHRNFLMNPTELKPSSHPNTNTRPFVNFHCCCVHATTVQIFGGLRCYTFYFALSLLSFSTALKNFIFFFQFIAVFDRKASAISK